MDDVHDDEAGAAGLAKAIEVAGSYSALARKIGVTDAAIHQWARVPESRVIDVEQATGISRSVLRPDVYPARKAPKLIVIEDRVKERERRRVIRQMRALVDELEQIETA